MPIAVIGAGSWGTAIAIHLARAHQPVILWGRNSTQIDDMQKQRENARYLPNISFPTALSLTSILTEAITQSCNIIIAVPSDVFRETLLQLKPHLHDTQRLLWLTKGIDPTSHRLLHQVAEEIFDNALPLAVLSGPSFAKEIAQGLPAALTLACKYPDIAKAWVTLFHHQQFRVYVTDDIIGVQLGGAIKNVLAIAVGIAAGLSCGENAQAALITRGLAEMMRLGAALGGQPETFMGLSGVGDLVLTCTSPQSRNRRFGVAIGQGRTQAAALAEIGQVVEGLKTTSEIYQLAQNYFVEMPIVAEVYYVLTQQRSPQQALKKLLSRTPKTENVVKR